MNTNLIMGCISAVLGFTSLMLSTACYLTDPFQAQPTVNWVHVTLFGTELLWTRDQMGFYWLSFLILGGVFQWMFMVYVSRYHKEVDSR